MSIGPRPVLPVQIGPAVLVQDADTLRYLYLCVQAGIQKNRRNGLSPAHLYPLSALFYRAHMSAIGHGHPVYVAAESDSTGQHTEFWTVKEAARELGIGERQVRRLAADGLGARKGREWMLPKARVLALKQERDWKARNGSRHLPRAA